MKLTLRRTLNRLKPTLPFRLRHAVPGIALATVLAISGTSHAQDLTGNNLNLTENGPANIFANGANTNALSLFVQGDIIQTMDTTSLSIFKRMDLEQAFPEIRFIPTGKTGFELETSDNFEISTDGAGPGAGMFKILGDAKSDALTLTANGIVVGGEDVSTENLSVVGNGLRSSLELAPNFAQDPNARIVVENTDNTLSFEARGTTPNFNQIFRASLDAPEDAITIQPGGLVSLGAPFASGDPFGGNPAIKLRVSDLMLFDGASSEWQVGAHSDFFGAGSPEGAPIGFLVHKDAGANALVAQSGGNVGLGTLNPTASLHVIRDDGSAAMLVEEISTTVANRDMMTLRNNGGVKFALDNSDASEIWEFTNNTVGNFQINRLGSVNPANGSLGPDFLVSKQGGMRVGAGGFKALDLRPSGNLFIAGSLTEMSDRNSKENYESIDDDEILEKLCDLSVTSWNYKSDDEDVRHIGPVAQDFRKAFGLGHNATTISTSDKVGVNMAAIKALKKVVDSKDDLIEAQQEEIVSQQNELEALQARMDRLENALLPQ